VSSIQEQIKLEKVLIQREPFDYTKWQSNLMEDMSIKEINDKAAEYRRQRS
jgi:hypothetical protein